MKMMFNIARRLTAPGLFHPTSQKINHYHRDNKHKHDHKHRKTAEYAQQNPNRRTDKQGYDEHTLDLSIRQALEGNWLFINKVTSKAICKITFALLH